MHIRIIFLLASLISFSNIHTVITNGMELIHPEKNMRIYLLGDLHENMFIDMIQKHQNPALPKIVTSIQQECVEQRYILHSFAQDLLKQKEHKSYVITETPSRAISHFVKHGLHDETQHTILTFLPYLFFQQVMPEITNKKNYFNLLKKAITEISLTKELLGRLHMPFQNEHVSWVIGDKFRNNTLISFLKNKEAIKLSLEQNKPLSPEIMNLSIGFLKQHILSWQRIFKQHQFNDIYSDTLLTIIGAALTDGLSESDHLIYFFEYSDQVQWGTKDGDDHTSVSYLIRHFESQIFDCELEQYIKCIDKSNENNQIVVLAGAKHTKSLSKSLQQQGYSPNKIALGISRGLNTAAKVERLCNREERKAFNRNLEQFLNHILQQNRVTKPQLQPHLQLYTPTSYLPYAPAVVAGSVGLLSLMSDNSKAKIVAGASIVATPLMALAARYYQTISNQ